MIKIRKITYTISGILVLLSLVSMALWRFNFGIDFKGGSLMEIEFAENKPKNEEIKTALGGFDLGDVKVQSTGDKGYVLRFKSVDEETHQKILVSLKNISANEIEEKRFDSIGSTIGKELQKKALMAIALVILMIVIYISFAFRQSSKPVSSWKYGVAAVIALIHDIAIPTGVFSILGHFKGVEIDSLFVTALLTILGFSVHDTIVVFDRTRENLKKRVGNSFEETVDTSVRQVFKRSIITSLTIILVLSALLAFGGETTRFFSLALIIGIFSGAYSSIFIASPILVSWNNWSQKKNRLF